MLSWNRNTWIQLKSGSTGSVPGTSHRSAWSYLLEPLARSAPIQPPSSPCHPRDASVINSTFSMSLRTTAHLPHIFLSSLPRPGQPKHPRYLDRESHRPSITSKVNEGLSRNTVSAYMHLDKPCDSVFNTPPRLSGWLAATSPPSPLSGSHVPFYHPTPKVRDRVDASTTTSGSPTWNGWLFPRHQGRGGAFVWTRVDAYIPLDVNILVPGNKDGIDPRRSY
ncbi:hypothetical protein OF83DRAFT_676682 [Amylostereum chailletii]|nr:hypothetical protein OF83DRAFT_676682 [Amylostereum chailletii]